MTHYIVIKQGVGRHEIAGVFSDKQVAIDRARDCMLNEPDAYHSFTVDSIELDAPFVPVVKGQFWGRGDNGFVEPLTAVGHWGGSISYTKNGEAVAPTIDSISWVPVK